MTSAQTPRSRGTVSEFGGERHVLFTRYLEGAPDEVWGDLTDPDRLARWFGTVTGDVGAGRLVLAPVFGSAGAVECVIERCDAPVRVEAQLTHGRRLWFELVPDEDVTVLTVGIVLTTADTADAIAADGAFVLDRLVAVREGRDAASVDPADYLGA